MFSPAGNVLATGGDDYFLRLWDVSSGSHDNRAFKPFLCPISAVGWNPQGYMLAVAGTDQQIGLVRTRPSFGLVKKFSGHSECITALHFNRAGKHVFSGSSDRTVRVWDVQTGEMVKQIPTMSTVTCMDVNSMDTSFASGHKTGDIRIYSMSSLEKTAHIQNAHSSQITSINFTNDRSQIVTTSTDGVIKIFDMRTQKAIDEIDCPELSIPAVCSSVGLSRND